MREMLNELCVTTTFGYYLRTFCCESRFLKENSWGSVCEDLAVRLV